MKRFPEDFRILDGVWQPFVPDPIPYSDGDEPERYLEKVLESASDLSSDSQELALAVKDWPSQYHLTPLRSNIFRCLGIRRDARVLELGCGCGALTRYLGENASRVLAVEGSPVRARLARMRCRGLDNVDIVAGNFDGMSLGGPFDVVTLIGVIEYAARYWRRGGDPFEGMLRLALEHLSPGGVLALAIENKLGMKYFSGCAEDHLSALFPGIEGYPDPGGPRTFGRQELVDLAARSGFTEFELLLPFPDYKLPSVFINARFASAAECLEYNLVDWCRERFQDYTREREHLFCDQLALASAAKTGLMADFSNSFLLLASKGPFREDSPVPRPGWIARKYNLLRRPEYRTITTLAAKGGVPAVTKERVNDLPPSPDSPVIHSVETALPFVASGKSLFLEMLRAIRRADGGEEELAGLVARWADFLRGNLVPGTDRLPPGHLDAVPVNLILDRDGALHYIDDEWRWNGPVPPDWVLFRGLFVFWLECRPWVDRFLGRADAGFGGFLARALAASGVRIDGDRLDELAGMETALHNAVSPFLPIDYRGLAGRPRAERPLPPPIPFPPAPASGEAGEIARVEELFGSGEVLKALSLAGELMKRYPGNATNWNNLGVILDSLGRSGEAKECFKVALSLDAGLRDAADNLRSLEGPA